MQSDPAFVPFATAPAPVGRGAPFAIPPMGRGGMLPPAGRAGGIPVLPPVGMDGGAQELAQLAAMMGEMGSELLWYELLDPKKPNDRKVLLRGISRRTGLTTAAATLCLDALHDAGWGLERLEEIFNSAVKKDVLNPSYFILNADWDARSVDPDTAQEFAKMTGLTMRFARLCLHEAGMDRAKAVQSFKDKAQALPAEALEDDEYDFRDRVEISHSAEA